MKSIPTPLPEPKIFAGKLAIQQRVLPSYRVPFFDILAQQCTQGAVLYAGQARKSEMIQSAQKTNVIEWHQGKNLHILKSPVYLCWQTGNLDWLKEKNPDVLITEANPRYLSTDRLIRWMHANHRPVIGWGLGAPPVSGPLSKLRTQRRKKFLQKFDALLAYSENGAQEYIQLGIPADRVFTAYNAVAPRPSQSPPTKSPSFDTQPIVLFVGRLQARKRLDLLIQACANLPKEQQPLLWIVGDGPARVEAEALSNQIYPHTKFLGAIHGEALSEIFYQADLFVLPGTGGLAIQEAMAHGLPVIVAEGDGTQNDLVRPQNGWLIRPNDLQDLTQKLSLALSDAQKLRQMGAESFRIANQEININAMANRFVDAIQKTLASISSSII
jgi:glycosyltransferase involved in cell wall biosynthesis